jgi:hypothetical protein
MLEHAFGVQSGDCNNRICGGKLKRFRSKRFQLALALILIPGIVQFSGAEKAMATNYVCEPTQIYTIPKDDRLRLESPEAMKVLKYTMLFNDETGDAWITKPGYEGHYQFDKGMFRPIPFKIVETKQDRPRGGGWSMTKLTAIVGDPADGTGNSTASFILSGRFSSDPEGIPATDDPRSFLFFSGIRGVGLSIGGCRVYKDIVPPIDRNTDTIWRREMP